jgi:hypothetical protein
MEHVQNVQAVQPRRSVQNVSEFSIVDRRFLFLTRARGGGIGWGVERFEPFE